MPKPPTPPKNNSISHSKVNIDQFLQTVKTTDLKARTQSNQPRLIFSLDATASRQRTWDQASALTVGMFSVAAALDIQLVYYRGYGECRASPWLTNADSLVRLMKKVSCLAGTTQIERVLRHTLNEARTTPVQGLVFVGDCVEENVDRLGNLAGELKLIGGPMFIFQEGHDQTAHRAFSQLATLTGGAHCQFDTNSDQQLGELLNAVAAYAAGGKNALKRLAGTGSKHATNLLQQLR